MRILRRRVPPGWASARSSCRSSPRRGPLRRGRWPRAWSSGSRSSPRRGWPGSSSSGSRRACAAGAGCSSGSRPGRCSCARPCCSATRARATTTTAMPSRAGSSSPGRAPTPPPRTRPSAPPSAPKPSPAARAGAGSAWGPKGVRLAGMGGGKPLAAAPRAPGNGKPRPPLTTSGKNEYGPKETLPLVKVRSRPLAPRCLGRARGGHDRGHRISA